MAKEWIVTQWIKDQLGIKNPAKEMAKMNMELGEIAQKGFLDGLKKGMDKMDMSTVSRDNHTIIDPLLKEVDAVVWHQQEKVLKAGKYPHPIHKDNHTALEWMDHQMSEFADALVYHQCLKQTIQDVVYLIDQAREWNKETRVDKSDIVDAILSDALDRIQRG